MPAPPPIAIVHEWFDTVAGSEKVLEQILLLYPHADLFALVDALPGPERGLLHGRPVATSFIQRLPFARRRFRAYLPVMPLAVEQFDLSPYRVVISNSHAFAKGVLTGPGQTHICYCHTPLRYAWDLQHEYLNAAGLQRGLKSVATRAILHYLRLWDARTAPGVDAFATNSTYVAARIRKVYGRDATVIPPPVDTEFFQPSPDTAREDWYVTASRLAPYKRTELLVEAFSAMPRRKLVVIGDGPQMARCRRLAAPNVEFRGHVSGPELRDALRRARAFVFAAEEDFGIAPVEAQACGTPVICYGRGGVRDSILDGITGVFYEGRTPEDVRAAVERFEAMRFDPHAIRANAGRFSIPEFRRRFRSMMDEHTQTQASAVV